MPCGVGCEERSGGGGSYSSTERLLSQAKQSSAKTWLPNIFGCWERFASLKTLSMSPSPRLSPRIAGGLKIENCVLVERCRCCRTRSAHHDHACRLHTTSRVDSASQSRYWERCARKNSADLGGGGAVRGLSCLESEIRHPTRSHFLPLLNTVGYCAQGHMREERKAER